jgi:hypothetical protein
MKQWLAKGPKERKRRYDQISPHTRKETYLPLVDVELGIEGGVHGRQLWWFVGRATTLSGIPARYSGVRTTWAPYRCLV